MNKMIQTKVLYMLVFLLMRSKKGVCGDFQMFLSVDNSEMKSSISTFLLGSGTACGALCKGRHDCASYGYTASTKTCSLNDKDPLSASSEVVTSPGSTLYVKLEDCDVGWNTFLGSCFLFSMTKRSWESSKAYCESLQATLVTVEIEQEHQFIRKTVSSSKGYYWIGARYNYTAGEHRWIDGSAITLNGWKPGLPGSQKGCVDYLEGQGHTWSWLWNSHSDCVSTYGPCICEKWR